MSFPSDLQSYDYWLSFSFYQYRRPTFAGNPVLADQGTIKLPLPSQLLDSQGVRYSEQDLDLAVGAGLNGLSGGSASEAAAGFAGGGAINAINGLASLAGPAGNQAVAGGLQLAGLATNPWTTIMFKGPVYRKFNLTWILTPSNEAESRSIYNMINTFKFNMLPDSSGAIGGTLLTYPNICQVTARNGKSNYWNYMFKPAVIESMQVNYAGAGQPSFFGVTKAPTAIEIRLSLQEIEFFLQRDYGTPNSRGIANIGNFQSALDVVRDAINPTRKQG